ncbi:hypothetical protein DEU56DRAFT_722559 [Suillus clintonianus]|uniref:uncharacterized protein n=1 Tax=Suillus clintonianus TaxID=1904413 RepID=UPI001B883A6B|nr:uncharacterized protein DEU56DRAFT_722559 [Suillus clintonianus]KAG2157552.1 hypothetical protein DEU56DRAFT_722559 [Suillus clintonianus]
MYNLLSAALLDIPVPTPSRSQSTFHLSADANTRIDRVLSAAWADSTLAQFRHSISLFINFCDAEQVPFDSRCPASEDLLCVFAASRAGGLSGNTVHNQLMALKAWHAFNNAKWQGGSRLHYLLNGVADLTPNSSKLPLRPPVSHSMLSYLASSLNSSNHLDVCCLAAATITFWGQLRLGEILSPWENLFIASRVSCRSDLGTAFNDNGSRRLHLPFTKVKKTRGEDIILCRQADSTDSISALAHHLAFNSFPPEYPLFSYITITGPRCLTKRKFLSRCNACWSSAGYPTLTGHSFRIDGTTEMLLAGVDPNVVKVLGRWSSDSFPHYWRSLELLAPRHVEFLPN